LEPIQVIPPEELFSRIATGEEAAFEALFNQYYERLYSVALQYCKVEATSEDIVQQVFLTVWEKRAELPAIKIPEAWLFILARNRVLNTLQAGTVRERYQRYAKELFSAEEGSPEELLISRQRRALLDKSMDMLTDKQRQMYKLHREQGMTYEEIAVATGLGYATVKEHIAKALRKIREFLLAHRDELLILVLSLQYFF
jgi:RNA polymerase sigma-70 factor (family 1)